LDDSEQVFIGSGTKTRIFSSVSKKPFKVIIRPLSDRYFSDSEQVFLLGLRSIKPWTFSIFQANNRLITVQEGAFPANLVENILKILSTSNSRKCFLA